VTRRFFACVTLALPANSLHLTTSSYIQSRGASPYQGPTIYVPSSHTDLTTSSRYWLTFGVQGTVTSYPACSLLLKPISTRSQLPCSAYRPTRASVLSSHIESVIASLSVPAQSPPLYAAPHGCEPLRATLPDLSSPQQGRPRLAGVANYKPLARQRIVTCPLLLTKAENHPPYTVSL